MQRNFYQAIEYYYMKSVGKNFWFHYKRNVIVKPSKEKLIVQKQLQFLIITPIVDSFKNDNCNSWLIFFSKGIAIIIDINHYN